MDLNSVYQELILKHYRRPNNRGKLEDADVEIHRLNPTCGDEIILQLKVRDDRIEAARFHGDGCAISQASASMMTQLLEGKSLAEADAITARFLEMMHGSEEAARDKALGDLRALAGVSKLPVRVRCAVLAWDALREAEKQVKGGG